MRSLIKESPIRASGMRAGKAQVQVEFQEGVSVEMKTEARGI